MNNASLSGDSSRVEPIRPRLGILATHAIQYQIPLYKELSRRAIVDLDVAFLSLRGALPYQDGEFGVTIAWDIDLLHDYRSTLIGRGKAQWLFKLAKWLRKRDVVVIHGHASPEMLLAIAWCRALHVPYLLRGESGPETEAVGARRLARHLLATFSVSGAAGALPIGKHNAAFYRRYGNIPQFLAPYSVDNDRFRATSEVMRSMRTDRLTSLGLDPGRPTVIFAGKLTPRKRPLDAINAIDRCNGELNLLMLGDGPLRADIGPFEKRLPVRCLGFINQADLPSWYASGDMLVLPSEKEPWGLVVNEGMACGLIPVVSDAVGCAPDLVDGIGEIFPVGDVGGLSSALMRASRSATDRRKRLQQRLERYSITETAQGYERAALALHGNGPGPSR
jgi:glycosyltransferase involved in cell wall biosynthesis